jgi:predicted transcriptional regulator
MASRAVDEIRRDPSDTDLNALVRRWRFRAFRRIFGKNALEHEKRRVVYELIRSNPGIDIREIASLTGINKNTLRYHLGRLQAFGNIVTSGEGGVVRYYENHGRYDPLDRKRIARRWHSTSARILDLIAQKPGVSRGEIAQALGISGPSATRWLKRFAKESVVEEVADGRFVRYYPAGM